MKRIHWRDRLAPVVLAFAISITGSILAADGPKLIRHAEAVPGYYTVVLVDDTRLGDVESIAHEIGAANGVVVFTDGKNALRTFTVSASDEQALLLSADPRVKVVEAELRARVELEPDDLGHYGVMTDFDPACAAALLSRRDCKTLDDRLWHLDRIARDAPDPQAADARTYPYCCDGTGVRVYAIDMGAWNRSWTLGQIAPGYDYSGDPNSSANDPCYGDFSLPGVNKELPSHGIAVASVINGPATGVAKRSVVVPMKTVRCDRGAHAVSHPYRKNAVIIAPHGERYVAAEDGTTATEMPDFYVTTCPPENPNCGCTPDHPCPRLEVRDGSVTWNLVDAPQLSPVAAIAAALKGLKGLNRQGAVVTLSTYAMACLSGNPACRDPEWQDVANAARDLTDIPIFASANNQAVDACNTIPAALSQDPLIGDHVITVGGTMLLNDPDVSRLGTGALSTDFQPFLANPADPPKDARWLCGAGDSIVCSPALGLNPTAADYKAATVGSNFGRCVSIFAPAKNITVASMVGLNTYRDSRGRDTDASGTSWAAPMAAAVGARFLSMRPNATAKEVKDAILNSAVADAIDPFTIGEGSPNLMLRAGDVMWTKQPAVVNNVIQLGQPVAVTFKIAAPAGATYSIRQGTRSGSSTEVKADQTVPPGDISESFPATTSARYFVHVKGFCPTDGHFFAGDSREFLVNVVSSCGGTLSGVGRITQSPSREFLVSGASVSLSVNASVSGNGTWAYQWLARTATVDFHAIADGPSNVLTVSPSETTLYKVRVYDPQHPASCVAESDVTTVNVLTVPTSGEIIRDTSLAPAGGVVLTLPAKGDALTYSWCNGPCPGNAYGCTSRTCRIESLPTGTTTIHAVARNEAGEVTKPISITHCNESMLPFSDPIPVYHVRDQDAILTVSPALAGATYEWHYGIIGDARASNDLTCVGSSGSSSNTCTVAGLRYNELIWVRIKNQSGTCYQDRQFDVKVVDCDFPTISVGNFGGVGRNQTLLATAAQRYDYQWYLGTAVPSNPQATDVLSREPWLIVPTPATYVNYTVRATPPGAGSLPPGSSCYRDTLVTVTCPRPRDRATHVRQSLPVTPGTQVQLSVPDYDDTQSIHWYTGPDLQHLSPSWFASGPTVTVTPLKTTTYRAELSPFCGDPTPAYSGPVTVTVASCSPVHIDQAPQSNSIAVPSLGAYVNVSAGVVVGGTGPFTYRWYIGEVGNTSSPIPEVFDVYQVPPGQLLSYGDHVILRATGNTSYRVWLQVIGCNGSLATAQAVTLATTEMLPAPTGVSVQTQPNTAQVQIQWSPVTGATGYWLDMATNINGPYTATGPYVSQPVIQTVATSSNPGVYFYRVRAIGPAGASTNFSAVDYAVTAPTLFTNEPLTTSTKAKAAHIAELRKAVDALRTGLNLPAIWASQPAPAGGINAASVIQIIGALNQARSLLFLAPVTYPSNGSPVSHGPIRASQLQILRDALR